MENFIQLKKDNILRIGIKDCEGKETGEYLEFDLEDIELPFRYNKSLEEHQKNLNWLQSQYVLIEKKQNKKTNGFLLSNDKEKLFALKEFYKRETQSLDLFLGKNGTKKLLNGRNPFYSMFEEFSEILEPIMPLLDVKADDIKKKIEAKYSKTKEEKTLE